MEIEIRIKNGHVDLCLRDGRKIAGRRSFPENRDLSKKLLPSIDELLRENGLAPKDIRNVKLDADMDDSYTTYRIAKAAADTFNWAVKER